jgi:hypothetical protein
MTAGDKIATLLFWIVAASIAVIVAGDNLRIGFLFLKPWRIGAALLLCVVAAFGVRECVRSVARSCSMERS